MKLGSIHETSRSLPLAASSRKLSGLTIGLSSSSVRMLTARRSKNAKFPRSPNWR